MRPMRQTGRWGIAGHEIAKAASRGRSQITVMASTCSPAGMKIRGRRPAVASEVRLSRCIHQLSIPIVLLFSQQAVRFLHGVKHILGPKACQCKETLMSCRQECVNSRRQGSRPLWLEMPQLRVGSQPVRSRYKHRRNFVAAIRTTVMSRKPLLDAVVAENMLAFGKTQWGFDHALGACLTVIVIADDACCRAQRSARTEKIKRERPVGTHRGHSR